MAISLERVQRRQTPAARSKTKKVVSAKSPRSPQRPWQSTGPRPVDPALDFLEESNNYKVIPEELEAATTTELLQELAQSWLQEKIHRAQRQSYWLSRLTHQNSWLARVQIFPRVRIPLPSWLSHKEP